MTTFIETHGYGGFSAAGGPLAYVITIGFVTIGFAPYRITKKIDELTQALKGIVK